MASTRTVSAKRAQRAQTAWREVLRQHAQISCLLENALREHGLGISEYEILDRLAEDEQGKLRAQELERSVHLTQSALSRAIARLEREGLVERALCEADRRGVFVALTDEGRSRHAAAEPGYLEILAQRLEV